VYTETISQNGITYKKGSHGFIFRLSGKSSGESWLKSTMTTREFDRHLKAAKAKTERTKKQWRL